ncbi:hypothetical protein D3C86_2102830 [compost metagenome]
MYSSNKSILRLHIHYLNPGDVIGISGYEDRYYNGGPSTPDYNNARRQTDYYNRFVVVDASYIYLYNSNPNETITIKRP